MSRCIVQFLNHSQKNTSSMCSKNIKYKHRKLICVLTNKLLETKGFKQEILKSTKRVYYGFSHLLYI